MPNALTKLILKAKVGDKVIERSGWRTRFGTATPFHVDSEETQAKGAAHVSVAKVIEITSTSPGSFEDAIRKGIAKAQHSIEGIRGAWISEHKVELADDGTIRHFRVDMKLTFVLED